ncbi:GTP cyclohydrolase 1 type 2 [Clostridium polyendosporum]|uniref:GTP cyclohydrolase 1 type 2 homolog n=1 Tax=Clostridium polyendosporum TaxID=69208 RepID=A0A919RYE9_9CLOT|nr:Nif3-like dinuclear metal center hexameric protein [Clostridium polyendosporum]GIM28054.1 GTP cyclohydrolase 1 type 2 [Clostridium polyendosporum]
MKVRDIASLMESIAPLELKESFDNVGLMVGDMESTVSKVLIALDCTLQVIEEAKKEKVELIITHHPLLFRKPSSITTDTLLGKKIIELIKSDINLYSAHTNLDSIKEGMNDTIVRLLGFSSDKIIELSKQRGYENSGLGRIISVKDGIELQSLIKRIKQKLGVNSLRYAGKENQVVRTIAVINGSGQDFFEVAKRMGADCIITGDTTYHFVSDFKELGISIIDIGHFSSEWPALVAISENIKEQINKFDSHVDIIISKASEDPYSFA